MPASDVLPESRRPGEEDVVHGLAPLAGRLQHDPQVLDQLRLPQELRERPGPEPDLLGLLGAAQRRRIDHPTARTRVALSPGGTGGAGGTGVREPVRRRHRLGSTARTSRRARGLTGSPRGQLAERQAEHLFHPDIVA